MAELMLDRLFEEVLLSPAVSGADSLYIVSGFASAAMAARHVDALRDRLLSVRVELEVGMAPRDGVSAIDHRGFRELVATTEGEFTCTYALGPTWTHSKVYAWSRRGRPFAAFVGSADYTQTGFASRETRLQDEVLVEVDPVSALDYVGNRRNVVDCGADIPHSISIFDLRTPGGGAAAPESTLNVREGGVAAGWGDLESIDLSLVSGRTGDVAGLNHGQREARDSNQAYLPVSAEINRRNFFPARGDYFSVLTDDGESFVMRRTGQNDKNLMTPVENAMLGRYFRGRLGVASGALVRRDDLEAYGRENVTFYRVDDECYYLDFAAN